MYKRSGTPYPNRNVRNITVGPRSMAPPTPATQLQQNQSAINALAGGSRFFSMRTMLYVLFLLLTVGAAWYVYTQFFGSGSKESMDSGSGTGTATVMLFKANYCGACKQFQPTWETFKKEFDGKNVGAYRVRFIEYECGTDDNDTKALMTKYKVDKFPTLKLLKDGQVVNFEGARTEDNLEQFLRSNLGG